LLADLGLAGALPGPTFFRSFLGAAVVSGILAVVAARLTDTEFDLDRLGTEIQRLDGSETAADGGLERCDTGADRGEVRD
jgi:hypothetical protein